MVDSGLGFGVLDGTGDGAIPSGLLGALGLGGFSWKLHGHNATGCIVHPKQGCCQGMIDAGTWVHHAAGRSEPRLASTGTCQAYATEHAARGKAAFDLNIGMSLVGAVVSHVVVSQVH